MILSSFRFPFVDLRAFVVSLPRPGLLDSTPHFGAFCIVVLGIVFFALFPRTHHERYFHSAQFNRLAEGNASEAVKKSIYGFSVMEGHPVAWAACPTKRLREVGPGSPERPREGGSRP
jgi:hypothetical protein